MQLFAAVHARIAEAILLVVGVAQLATAEGAQAQEHLMPVHHIDHIMIRSDKPAELYKFLTEVLQLPVAWPLADRGGVISGAVAFGNVNVEAIKFPGQTNQPTPTHLVGFGLKPIPLSQSLSELTRRGIEYGEPRPFVSTTPNGTRMTFFTNVTLRQFSDSDRPADATTHIFLSEYNPAYVDIDARRARLRTELAAIRGGPLGVVGVNEVVIGATDPGRSNRLWEALLRPTQPATPGLWRIGDGPAVRVVPAAENRLQALVVRVASIDRAIAFLSERALLEWANGTEAAIARSALYGVSIRLTEASGAAPHDVLLLTRR